MKSHDAVAKPWGLLMALALVWGPSFFFNRIALDAFPPMTLVLLRVGLAALALNLLLPVLGHRMPGVRSREHRAQWIAFFGMGCLNNLVPFCLIVWGQTHIASGLAAILNATTPISTMIIAHWATPDEKMTRRRFAGVLIGFSGVVVMVGQEAWGGFGAPILAQLAVLGATVSYGCAGIYGRRFKTMGVSPLRTAAGQLTASTLLLLPIALWVDRPWSIEMPGASNWGAIVTLALASTALAYLLYFRILEQAGATHLLLVTFMMPALAILLGVTVLGEHLTGSQVAGMALIGLGLAAIDGRPWDLLRGRMARPRPSRPRPSAMGVSPQSVALVQTAWLSAMR